MKLLVPQNISFFDASIWKMYAYKNQIWEFFECIKARPVILVGPEHYKDFGALASFSNYTHLPIHGSKASINRREILDSIIQKHQSFKDAELPPIYFFVAGSVSVYFVYHLHQRLEKKFLIDVGQAFNFLYHKKEALLHREFGYSEKEEKGRKSYNTQRLYGKRNFHSNMRIENNLVSFDLKLSFREIWLEKLMLLVNERAIRRKLLYLKYKFHNIFKNAKNTEK